MSNGRLSLPGVMAFTARADGRLSSLRTDVEVWPAFMPGAPPPPSKRYHAIYDTGATGSAISENVAQELGLKSIGLANVQTAMGVHDTLSKATQFPQERIKSPTLGVNLWKQRVGTPFSAVNLPRQRAGTPFSAVNLPRQRAGTPFSAVNLPRQRVGTPFSAVNLPRQRVEMPFSLAEPPREGVRKADTETQ